MGNNSIWTQAEAVTLYDIFTIGEDWDFFFFIISRFYRYIMLLNFPQIMDGASGSVGYKTPELYKKLQAIDFDCCHAFRINEKIINDWDDLKYSLLIALGALFKSWINSTDAPMCC